MEVIGKAVGIVILLLGTIEFGLIGPDIVLQVGMLDVNTRIKNGDNGTLVGNGLLLLKEIELQLPMAPLLTLQGVVGFVGSSDLTR